MSEEQIKAIITTTLRSQWKGMAIKIAASVVASLVLIILGQFIAIREGVASLKTDTATINTKLDAIKEANEKQDKKDEQIEGRVRVVESSCTSLKERVDNVEKKIETNRR